MSTSPFPLLAAIPFLLGLAAPASAKIWPTTGQTIAHDPTLVVSEDLWWYYSTGKGLKTRHSTDGVHWIDGGPLYTEEQSWWRNYAPKMDPVDIWAPDITFYNGRYWMYYSVSEFGKNNSAIGLRSCTSLTKADWREDGAVVWSQAGVHPYNAIDPHLCFDQAGKPWMAFGSWFGGIALAPVDPATMKLGGEVKIIAKREGGIEGPSLMYSHGYYHLFVSIDFCCRGVESNYKIVTGRAKSIEGPYVDRTGKPLLEGGGTVLEVGGDRWKGPGGQDVYEHNGQTFLIRHAYDTQDKGEPHVRLGELYWDAEGWPTLTDPTAKP